MISTLKRIRHYQDTYLRFDITAALVVFLVAIPLCLGISIASNAPLFSGILSGIIGGIIVGSLSGSSISVSGPAAGMAAVVVTSMSQLGDFQTFLFALVLGGILQCIMGSLKAGFIADYIPTNVIQGLLCAIGLLLIIKQLPLAFMHSQNIAELKQQLLEITQEGFSLAPLWDLKDHVNYGASIISLCSFIILIGFDKIKISWLKAIPATVVVVILGVCLNEFFVLFESSLAQDTPQLVQIPQNDGFGDLVTQFVYPHWDAWRRPEVYLYAFMIALVASLETLLNVQAGEKLDTRHQRCSKNRELFAQGIGNICSGCIGGLPITSVVVRTSINIQTGAKTKASTILHGIFILCAIIWLPHALNHIPLSSLATVLIYTGYKLTSPKIYRTIYNQGIERFIPFIVTIIGIIGIDLLAGILLGLFVSLFYILKSSSQARIDIIQEINPNGTMYRIVLPQQITFLNKASLVEELDTIQEGSQLIIDARYADYIDKEIIQYLKEFQKNEAVFRKISLNLIGFKDQYAIHNYIDFLNVTTYDAQSALTPHEVLLLLREGNQRLLQDRRIHRSISDDIKQTASGQHPIAVILGCIDSRVPVETIFDMSFGDLFCVRIAGNVVNEDILASIEYACQIIGAKLIVVLGHTSCGAIAAACDQVEHGHITQLLKKIDPAIHAETTTPTAERHSRNASFVNHITHLNIANTLIEIYDRSPTLSSLIRDEKIGIIGAVYDVSSGIVRFESCIDEVSQLPHANPMLIETLKQFASKEPCV